MSLRPFHLAFPVNDLADTKTFFTTLLGCEVGRENAQSIVFNFFGHQLVAHHSPEDAGDVSRNTVDVHQVPVRHFGIVLGWQQWQILAERLRAHEIEFIIEPTTRYAGTSGEQATMFFLDPSNNALEFKAFRDDSYIFAPWKGGEKP